MDGHQVALTCGVAHEDPLMDACGAPHHFWTFDSMVGGCHDTIASTTCCKGYGEGVHQEKSPRVLRSGNEKSPQFPTKNRLLTVTGLRPVELFMNEVNDMDLESICILNSIIS